MHSLVDGMSVSLQTEPVALIQQSPLMALAGSRVWRSKSFRSLIWMEGLLVDDRNLPVAWSVSDPQTLVVGQNKTIQMSFDTKTYWSSELVDLSMYGKTADVSIRFNAKSYAGLAGSVADIYVRAGPAIKSASFTYAGPETKGKSIVLTANYVSINKTLPLVYRWDFCGVGKSQQLHQSVICSPRLGTAGRLSQWTMGMTPCPLLDKPSRYRMELTPCTYLLSVVDLEWGGGPPRNLSRRLLRSHLPFTCPQKWRQKVENVSTAVLYFKIR